MAKKKCEICNNEVGLLSRRDLKDAIVCSDCLRKLGKEFSLNSESFTLVQIKSALDGEIELKEPLRFQCNVGTLVLDSNNRVIYMQLPLMQTSKEIQLDSIVGYSYIEDEKEYGVGHVVGGAAIGGVLFGGAGAVVGAVAGSNPKRHISTMRIEITYEENGKGNIFNIDIHKGQAIKASSIEYKSKLEIIKNLMAQLDVLIEKDVNNSEEVVTLSGADEIRKYKELYDEGIITEEEFIMKKKQLLGI